jgi:hypothetical protein
MISSKKRAAICCRAPDHDDFGLNQSKIIVMDSSNLERDSRSSLRDLRKPDCAGKAAQRPTFPVLVRL